MRKHQIRKWTKWLWLFCLACGMAACDSGESTAEAALPPKDCEVTVSVRLDAVAMRGMGDPGGSTGESEAPWTRIDVFLVYDWGQVLRYSMGAGDYVPGDKRTFLAFAGTVTEVYAVAYQAKGEETVAVAREQDIRNLRTADLSAIGAAAQKGYLLSLFSGQTAGPVEIEKERITTIDVTLHRLVAKVDVQWDAQDAYESGDYVEARMGGITFYGAKQGWFFPQFHEDEDLSYSDNYQVSDPVSERNGRTYFYTFSGQRNRFMFSVFHQKAHGSEEETRYTATFNEPLEPASWHKVNLSVQGTTFEESSHELTLNPKIQSN